MKLPKLSLDNYQFTVIVFLLLTIFGLTSYLNMPRTENPTVYIPGASVIVIYPGANPMDMEQLIASPIEEAINELDDIIKISTKIQDGIAAISVEFSYDTDAREKYNEVVQQVNAIRNDLPDDIFSIDFWRFSSSDVAMMQLALTGDSAEYSDLERSAEKLKDMIEKVNGVSKVEIVACPEQELRVSLDLEKMAQMNISLEQVANAIISNNANIPGGSVDIGNKHFNIKTSGSFRHPDELKNIVVNSYNGRIIYLRNIADIKFAYEDQNYIARFNGRKAIFVVVKQKPELNIFDITGRVKPEIERFRKSLDSSIHVETVFDQSSIVDERISGFMNNLLQGVILVGLIILLALGFKSSIIVILAIPLSLLVGLGFVDVWGIGLQQITIAALVVALGLLVDNSIVMVENINRYMAMGYHPKEAAVLGASEIGWPIISATATTLLAFIPIAMMPDKAGDFIQGLPVTIIATLTVSLLVALSLTPMVAGLVYKGYATKKEAVENARKKKGVEKLLQKFVEGPYRKALDYALRKKARFIYLSVIFFIVSIFILFRYVGISFFPSSETPQFLVRVNLPEGTGIERSDEAAKYVESVLDSFPEVRHYASNIGHGNPRIYYNVFSKNYAKNYADIYVELKEYVPSEFNRIVEELRNRFASYPGGKINVKVFEQGIPIDAPILIYVNGDDMSVLKTIADSVESYLIHSEGVINIENELSIKKSDLYVDINREKAGMFGVPVHLIDKTVRIAMNGAGISKYRDRTGKEFNIVLRLPVKDKIAVSDFDKIYITSLAGKQVPLSQLASLKFRDAPSKITRYNLQRTAVISADLEKGYSLDEIMKPVIQKLDRFPFPPGYNYNIRGELEARGETFGGMENAMVIAIIAIFAVLVLQFRSFRQPFIIFMAVPLAVIGSIFALLITGYTFSFTAFVGMISLIGIVINNSIILVDYTNKLRSKGIELIPALKEAGETRFTPIILTTLTTIGGLLPLTITGSEMWAPLGWTVIGGLIVSTLLTLLVVPVLYSIMSKRKADA
ncbi:MAG: efflux RND transporter permease subunit [Bacteroidota bacterium]